MAYSYRLITTDEAKRALSQSEASDPRLADIDDALTAASDEIQEYLERVVVQTSWIEYHQRSRTEPSVLRVKHWPISSVTEVAEDTNRDYGSTTVLTADTEYIVMDEDEHTSKIIRLSSDTPKGWTAGFEAIRVKVTGGWTVANMPPRIRRVCREYLARQYHAVVNQSYAFSRVNDARGDVTHFGPVMLTKPQLSTLSTYKDWGASTCVRFEVDSS